MLIKLSDLVQIRAGYQTRKGVEPDPYGSHFILQIRDFNESRTSFDPANLARIEADSVNNEQILRDGDVIFLSKGIRNFSFAPTNLPQPTLAASYFFILRPKSEIVPAYLSWFLNLDATKQLISKLASSGVHTPVVRRDVLEGLEIPVPEIESQQKIIELAGLMERQQELLVELAQAQKQFFTEVCLRLAKQ